MKKYFSFFVLFFFVSCLKDVDDAPFAGTSVDFQVKDFIWKNLNTYYLWQEQVPELADDYFEKSRWQTHKNSSSYTQFLQKYSSPKHFFNALLYKNNYENQGDRFSFIVEDYAVLERIFSGEHLSTGMEFSLYKLSSDELIGVVCYVVKGSPASEQNVQRGDIFMKVNGVSLTPENYQKLLYNKNSNISFSFFLKQRENFIPTRTITLEQRKIKENPIHTYGIIPLEGKKVGYLLYNGFIANYDLALNEIFGYFKQEGVNELILDLRYNSGGSVQTAAYLASMITGSYKEKIFVKEATNRKISKTFELNVLFEDNINGHPINHLHLKRICILTLRGTASASELIINGLKPYIQVFQIGETTTGKNLASITIRDYTEGRLNPRHRWALQPIVIRSENAAGFGGYQNGIEPNVFLSENYAQMGVLGTSSDPFVQRALDYFSDYQGFYVNESTNEPSFFNTSKAHKPYFNEMYLPENFINFSKSKEVKK